jgi:CDP-glycerol glycerophosphotransferase (TagB/SpsB family)
MKHSDVVINLASTVTIDAAVFDTPVINIAYNPALPASAWNYAEKWYSSTHYSNIVKAGGIRIAHSEAELIHHIQDYLHNPSRDKDGRRRLVEEQCYRIDGKASERIVDAIQEVVS